MKTNIDFSIRALAASALSLAALAAAPISLDAAGAASSGGVGQPGEEAESRESGDRYAAMWEETSRRDRRWAHKTAECESGRDPNAIGGGGKYRGAFQFLKSTWKASPKSPGGDPIDYSYKTQAVVAVKLKQRDGAGHWPVCG